MDFIRKQGDGGLNISGICQVLCIVVGMLYLLLSVFKFFWELQQVGDWVVPRTVLLPGILISAEKAFVGFLVFVDFYLGALRRKFMRELFFRCQVPNRCRLRASGGRSG